MPKLPILKAKELVKFLNKQGFYNYHQVGSHAQFKHFSNDRRRTTIPIHPSKEISKGTLKAILKDLGISTEEFMKLLNE